VAIGQYVLCFFNTPPVCWGNVRVYTVKSIFLFCLTGPKILYAGRRETSLRPTVYKTTWRAKLKREVYRGYSGAEFPGGIETIREILISPFRFIS